jgi:hypothetical protein
MAGAVRRGSGKADLRGARPKIEPEWRVINIIRGQDALRPEPEDRALENGDRSRETSVTG